MAKKRIKNKANPQQSPVDQILIMESYRKQVDELKGELKEEIRQEIKSDLARQIATEVASELRSSGTGYRPDDNIYRPDGTAYRPPAMYRPMNMPYLYNNQASANQASVIGGMPSGAVKDMPSGDADDVQAGAAGEAQPGLMNGINGMYPGINAAMMRSMASGMMYGMLAGMNTDVIGSLADAFPVADFPPRIVGAEFHIPDEIVSDDRFEKSKGERAAKKCVSFAGRVVKTAVAAAIVLGVGFGLYSLYDSNQVYSAADMSAYASFKPAEEDASGFEYLRRVNADVIGWLTVNETAVDFPMVQGADNDYYVNHTALEDFSPAGALFLDAENGVDFADFNSIIYGRQIDNEKMLGALSKFKDEVYFNNHPHGNLYFCEEWSGSSSGTVNSSFKAPEIGVNSNPAPDNEDDGSKTSGSAGIEKNLSTMTTSGDFPEGGILDSLTDEGEDPMDNMDDVRSEAVEQEETEAEQETVKAADSTPNGEFSNHGVEWVAFLQVNDENADLINPEIRTKRQKKQFLKKLAADATYLRDETLSVDDSYIMLSAMAADPVDDTKLSGSGYVLVGRLTREVYQAEETGSAASLKQVAGEVLSRILEDIAGGFAALQPLYAWTALIVLLPIFFILLLLRIKKRDNYERYVMVMSRWERFVTYAEQQSADYMRQMVRRFSPKMRR